MSQNIISILLFLIFTRSLFFKNISHSTPQKAISNDLPEWIKFYECMRRYSHQIIVFGLFPSKNVMVFEESVARLSCGLCIAPDEVRQVKWKYAKSTNRTFIPLPLNETIVHDNGRLNIYHVIAEDAGVYRCEIGQTLSGIILLEILSETETYDVVKPPTSFGPYSSPPKIITAYDLVVFSLWTPWSQCSTCGRVGRKRRFGPCYVKSIRAKTQEFLHQNTTSKTKSFRQQEYIKLFKEFPDGIACRSKILPDSIRDLDQIKRRRNEIMIGLCKEKCKNLKVHESYSENVYLLLQELVQSNPPVNTIMYCIEGDKTIIRCPGTTLQDIPISWKMDTKRIIPMIVDKESGGRIHVNARDHLVFKRVVYSDDAGMYSCWTGEDLIGTVKLTVWDGARLWNTHVTLTIMFISLCVVLHFLLRQLRKTQRELVLK